LIFDEVCLKNKEVNKSNMTRWTEKEHALFLLGLCKWGKGKWKEISKIEVKTRTPIQVASHAQKYYIAKLDNKIIVTVVISRQNHAGWANNIIRKISNKHCESWVPQNSGAFINYIKKSDLKQGFVKFVKK
jgi:SHAQKYF class myb-like DNA-binding protein